MYEKIKAAITKHTLKSIANNSEIDVIWEEKQPAVEEALRDLNAALRGHGTPFEVDTGGRVGQEIDFTAADGQTVELPSGEQEYLYDRPYEDKSRVRVAGPFTVESLSPHRVVGVGEDDELLDEAAERAPAYGERREEEPDFASVVIEDLKRSGVQQAHKEDKITFSSISGWPGELIAAARARPRTPASTSSSPVPSTTTPSPRSSTSSAESPCSRPG